MNKKQMASMAAFAATSEADSRPHYFRTFPCHSSNQQTFGTAIGFAWFLHVFTSFFIVVFMFFSQFTKQKNGEKRKKTMAIRSDLSAPPLADLCAAARPAARAKTGMITAGNSWVFSPAVVAALIAAWEGFLFGKNEVSETVTV